MKTFKNRIYHVDEFTNKEYAALLQEKTKNKLSVHCSLLSLTLVLYIITVALLLIPRVMLIPLWANSCISIVTPITYTAAFAIQIVAAYQMIILMVGAAFSAGLDIETTPLDWIMGGVYSVLVILVFFLCPPIAISNQITKDKQIIKKTEEILTSAESNDIK